MIQFDGKCFECDGNLQLPICPHCNPEFDIARLRAWRKWSWVGTALQLAGSGAIASNMIDPYWGYATMLPGALIWLAIAMYRRDTSQAALQAAFVCLNILGLIRWAA